ncbi:MAG: hypothetical protein HGA19_14170, partial [Oscillochloris sp.]|nr:hypothetical protein [Oscillochloris sp.]
MSPRVDCKQVHQHVEVAKIDTEAVAHIQGCARCRHALHLLSESLGLPPAITIPAYTCVTCQSQLASYIDRELSDPIAAAQAFPGIWWHLWSCPDCAEVYRMTHMLLEARRSGEIP